MGFTKVGLTGGIATGKSSVAELWRQRGAVVIDADALAHQTLAPGTAVYPQVVAAFGKQILNEDGTINRRLLGDIVFANAGKREQLNRLVHPTVHQMWVQALAETERAGKTEVAVVVIPLLYEAGFERGFDCVVAVGCSEQTQRARLRANGFDEEHARARIRSQWPVQRKMDRADFVVWNDGSPEVLHRQAEMIWTKIKEMPHAA